MDEQSLALAPTSSSPFTRRVVFALWLIGFWAAFVAAQDIIETGELLGKGKILNPILSPAIEGAKLAQLFCLIAAITLTTTRRQHLACFLGILATLASLLIFRLAKRPQEVGLWPIGVTQVAVFLLVCIFYRFVVARPKAVDAGLTYQLKIADLFILILAIAFLLNILRFRLNSVKQIFFADLELVGIYPRILLNVIVTTSIHSVAGLCLLSWIAPGRTATRTLLAIAIAAIAGGIWCSATQFALFYILYPWSRGQPSDQLTQFGLYFLIAFSFCGWMSLSIMLFQTYEILPRIRAALRT